MGNVIVCYKRVIDESDIQVNADMTIDISKANQKIGAYDLNAIQYGSETARILGGKSIGLTFGAGKEIKATSKDAMSRGLDETIYVNADTAKGTDGLVTAEMLAAAVQQTKDTLLIICGEGANDTYARQVPSRIGAILDWPVVTAVAAMELDGGIAVMTRKLENTVEKVRVSLPAVISVLPEIAPAPVPGLRAIMAAGKKPVTELDAGQLVSVENGVTELSAKGYKMDRKNILLDGGLENQVKGLVAALKKEGVL
ncbi:electron transfer flavoprotein beta subunit/FixA family protein [Desulfosporosinus fructosivorans]|uniref:Electron transfer flavoprotein small subunit n=1 Tax=Desulfosporosinus fructosivorans TaxID=2018669 RepID=A0A4Z0QX26_9FIRM|nr:electron transfer flavoprotein beta subunit/FixA family protein [Desulfosporosinus fructosivorans]TGE35351.1 electron transfer flavoprotein beta subunit/FixA family protein [Desulfosporosinus fructosivorans]